MPQNENITTKFKVDVSELKRGVTEANKTIKLANAQFKAASAGMDDWSSTSEGLEAKLQQLDTVIDAQKKKLASYEGQLEAVEAAEAENAQRAAELRAAYQKTVSQYGQNSDAAKKLEKALNDVEKEQLSNAEAADRLKVTILNQKAEVARVEKEHRNYAKRLEEVAAAAEDAAGGADEYSDALKNAADAEKDAEKNADNLSGGFTVMKGAAASLIADGLRKLVGMFKEVAVESDKAFKKFSASTGTAAQDMAPFQEAMEELYRGNYGESFEDIASAMAEVKQNARDMDPSNIKDLTKQALVLRDTFDFDVKESLRAANMLIDQFGYTGEEAFNLIAQGAQKGLDKNGDLLDTINEYSVHFQQLGYSGEEFFDILWAGSKNGTFSVDKLGDAYKEFGIRVKDTSATTTEAYQILGLDADEMRKKFLAGGDTAKAAADQTIAALLSMEDPIKQNQAGVDLFGTMFEDLGIDAFYAMSDVRREFQKTNQTMQEIDGTVYEDVGSQAQQLGRTLKTDLVMPLAKEVLPKFNEFIKKIIPPLRDGVTWMIQNFGKLVPVATGLGAAILYYKTQQALANKESKLSITLAAAQKVKMLAQDAALVVHTKNLTLAEKAQKLLNIAKSATPWKMVTGLIVSATVALGAYIVKQALGKDSHYQIKKSIDEEIKSRQELIDKQNEQMESGVAEIDHTKRLWDELQSIVDANGKIKEGYENRASFITGELAEALGVEIQIVDGQIQKYDELSQSIDLLIAKKRAQIILDSQEEGYKQAVQNKTAALTKLNQLETDMLNAQAERDAKRRELEARGLSEQEIMFDREYASLAGHAASCEQLYNGQLEVVSGYNESIAQYESDAAAIASGKADEIEKVNNRLTESYEENGEKRTLSLQQQVENERVNLNNLLELQKGKNGEMYNAQVEASQKRLEQLESELEASKSTTQLKGDEQVGIFSIIQNRIIDAINSKRDEFSAASSENANAAVAGMASVGPQVYSTGEEIAGKGVEAIREKRGEYEAAGSYALDGVNRGMDEKKGSLFTNIGNIANTLLSRFKGNLGIASPARAFVDAAGWIPVGTSVGVKKKARVAINSIIELGKNMLAEAAGQNSGFAAIGEGAVANLSTGFKSRIGALRSTVNEVLSNLGVDGGSLSVAKGALVKQNSIAMEPHAAASVVNNFVQNNYSPKALSRLEIYRQTKSQFEFAKGV